MPRNVEADPAVTHAETISPEDSPRPVDENFGKYPYDRFREAAEGRVSARDYASDLLRYVGVSLG